jgi:EsV-1-7 cysteine-rich motif
MVKDKDIKIFMNEYICIDPKKSYQIENLISVMIGIDLDFGLDDLYAYLTKMEYYFKIEKYEILGIYPIEEYNREEISDEKNNFKKIIGRHCVATGCTTRASFGMPEKKRRYCQFHKIEEMVNVVSPQCDKEGCSIRPTYNYPGNLNGVRCVTHALVDMEVVTERRQCEKEDCIKRPSCNFPGETRAIRCSIHKLIGMTDVMNPICEKEGCNTRACCNFPGETKAIWCGTHKLIGMIDVTNPRCEEEGCNTRASYNFPGEKRAIKCNPHKLNDMINILYKKCISCNIIYLRYPYKYDNYCMRCYVHTFPDNIISKKFKTKERMIADFIRENYSGDIYFDEIVNSECSSKRRPDVRIDRGVFNLIIEVDENQHRYYDPMCENKRTMQLFQDLGNRPLVMIRINPDHYYDKNGKKIDSCFDYKTLEMPSKNKEEFDRRMVILKQKIDYYMNYNDIPEKEIDTDTVLFFDGY